MIGAGTMVLWIGVMTGVTTAPVLWITLDECDEIPVGMLDTTAPTLATAGTETIGAEWMTGDETAHGLEIKLGLAVANATKAHNKI